MKLPDALDGDTPARSYFPGMGEAVADRTINRKIKNDDGSTRVETWAEVAERVSLGNSLLHPGPAVEQLAERVGMRHHLRQASLLMSGRHLQHGDADQPNRPGEVFTNCSTAATTFLLFYLLLNGSGVGRSYDDCMIKADFTKLPIVLPVINAAFKDVLEGHIKLDDGGGLYSMLGASNIMESDEHKDRVFTWFEVPDSREGWAKAVEVMERMAFEGRTDEVLVLDFSAVRPKGSPIRGMQNRPSSGPGPLMSAIAKTATLRGLKMAPWMAAMFADHYMAECVLVGGARRAARMATKSCWDKSVFDFIAIKKNHGLWSSNNSVMIDDEFRAAVRKVRELMLAGGGVAGDLYVEGKIAAREYHAWRVITAIAGASYYDGTGEPGIINVDRLTANRENIRHYEDGEFAESKRFKLDAGTIPLMQSLARAAMRMGIPFITNPCGEIVLLLLGAYCTIADVVPFYAQSDADAEDAFRVATRALIRTNQMDFLYGREVARTNRIGVGITGFHEWAYSRFRYTWKDIVDEERSKPMWLMLSRFKRAVVDEAERYATLLGVVIPHTNTTIKPAGTTSKLFGLTEGAHLPSMREYLRYVQFRNDDPLVAEYEAKGYPTKRLTSYEGTTIVGFPTRPTICEMDGGDWIVTAAEATPAEQYAYLRLLEKYWITGVAEDGVTPLAETGNQVSYTLKYDPKKVDFSRFLTTLIEGQFTIRCCSVMPQVDSTAYEYQPETPVSSEEFEAILSRIDRAAKEDIGFEHVDCGAGGCPIDFSSDEKMAA